jgi:hypothetical protein
MSGDANGGGGASFPAFSSEPTSLVVTKMALSKFNLPFRAAITLL